MGQLPDGTVSFLFSDVEGSTRLLERFGDRLTEALTAHHELLAHAVCEHRGVVFETVGDAVYAAFAEPAACALAAVAAQRAMANHDWGPLGDLRLLRARARPRPPARAVGGRRRRRSGVALDLGRTVALSRSEP